MDVRLLAPADALEYRHLRLRALAEHPEAFTSSFEEESARPDDWYAGRLAGGDTRFWGAFDRRELRGTVGLERQGKLKNRHKGLVIGMYVAAECTGRGMGRALVDVMIEAARQDGLEMLVLTVTDGNDAARTLYERCGFTSFGVEPRAIKVAGRAYDKRHMVLDLTAS